ncbi:MAG: family 78 glycoside hydrolase catalytic domain, partial [Bacteroidales bacterium]|nr:family 78 glycoside hydrolase catalytic domain [Bacteroidales bacterium]
MTFRRSLRPLVLILSMFACSNPSDKDSTSQANHFETASWIGSTAELPANDSLFYLDNPAPLLRKVFELHRVPKNAVISISAVGYYTLWINGEKIGVQELEPAWTDYSKRIYYRNYDINKVLRKGRNVVGIELGNGWYNPLPLRMWGHLNLREHLSVGRPRAIATINYNIGNDKQEKIVTDASWNWHSGNVIRNSIYLGEWHDLGRVPGAWKLKSFDDSKWQKVLIMDSPGGQLQLADFPPIKKSTGIKPMDIWQNDAGKWTIDFGQNMAGWIKYQGSAKKGDTIRFRFGERIWPDSTVNTLTSVCGQIKSRGVGGPGAPDIAEQIDVFIPGAHGDIFEPRYTFHGFRYVEISSITSSTNFTVGRNDLTAYKVGTDISKISTIESDLSWLNQIQTMVERTFTSNIFSVPSDCPAREKFGYGGDISVNAEAWLYNYDMKAIFIKFIRDWKDAMRDGTFVDTAPFVGVSYCGISWEASFLMLQEWLYKFYGDLDLVKEWYAFDQQWIQKALTIHGMDLVRKGLADHESLIPVPVELIGTANYYKSLRILQKFAALVEDSLSVKVYDKCADQIQTIMRDSLWLYPVNTFKNKQTWLATLLYHDILTPVGQQRAIQMLSDDLAMNGNCLTTGIFGTPYLLEVLSKNGHV